MSFQRHTLRNEIHLKHHRYFVVRVMNWHQITNPNDVQCNILKIQYGEETIEEDIERLI